MSGFPDGSVVKNQPAIGDDKGSIPKSRRSPGEGNGCLFQYSYQGNPMFRGGWRAAVHGVTKESDTTWQPSTHACNGCHGQIFLPTLGWKLSESQFPALFVAISPMTIVMLSTHLLNKRIWQEVKRMTDKTYRKTSEKGVISLSKTSKRSVNASGMFDMGLKRMGGFS